MRLGLKATLILLLGSVPVVWAGPLTTVPSISSVFPIIDTPQGVKMSAPVLLSLNAIIPAKAVLRVFYVRPQYNDPIVREIRKDQDKGSAYSRSTAPSNGEKPLPPEIQAAIRIASKSVWPQAINFQHAFEVMNIADMRIVFVPEETGQFADEIFNLPEGLLLSEQEGAVTVLAVEQERSAASAGFLAGDQLRSIGGQKIEGGLESFIKAYRAAQEASEKSGERQIIYEVSRKDQDGVINRTIKRPPSLKGSLLDMN